MGDFNREEFEKRLMQREAEKNTRALAAATQRMQNRTKAILHGNNPTPAEYKRQQEIKARDQALEAIRRRQNSIDAIVQRGDTTNPTMLQHASDFGKYSAAGANLKNPTYQEAQKGIKIGATEIGTNKPQNVVTFTKENADIFNGPEQMRRPSYYGKKKYTYMTDEEVAIYNYFLAKHGGNKANEFLESLDTDLDMRMTESEAQNVKEASKEHKGSAAAVNIGASLLGATGYAATLGHAAKNALTGENEPLNTNSAMFAPSMIQEATREGITKDMGTVGKTATNMSLGVGSMLANTALLGGASGFVNMGLNEASGVAKDVAERGGTTNQSLAESSITAGINTGLSLVGAKALSGLTKVAPAGAKDVLAKVLQGGLMMGMKDAVSTAAILVADEKIMKELSNIENIRKEYLAAGYSEEEADTEVEKQRALIIGQSFTTGFVSGAVMTGASMGMQAVTAKINDYKTQAYTKKGKLKNDPFRKVFGRKDNGRTKIDIDESGNTRGLSHYNEKGFCDGVITLDEKGNIYQYIVEKDGMVYIGVQNYKLGNNMLPNVGRYDMVDVSLTKDEFLKMNGGKNPFTDVQPTSGQTAAGQTAGYIGMAQTGTQTTAETLPTQTNMAGAVTNEVGQAISNPVQKVEIAKPVNTQPVAQAIKPITNVTKSTSDRHHASPDVTQSKAMLGDEQVTLVGPYVKEGYVKVENAAGELMAVKNTDLSYENKLTEKIYDYAVNNFGSMGANIYVSNYDYEMPYYNVGFTKAYNAGRHDMNLKEVKVPETVDAEVVRLAYKAGIADRSFAEVGKTKREETSTGIIENETSVRLQNENQEHYKALSALAEITNSRVILEDSITTSNGTEVNGYLDKDNKLHVNVNNDSYENVVISHEVTHRLKKTNPEDYKTFEDYVVDYFKKNFPAEYESRYDTLSAIYAQAGQNLDETAIHEEMAANATESFLMNEKFIEDIAKENKTLLQRIVDAIKSIIDDIKKLLKGEKYQEASPEGQMLAESVETLEKAYKLWKSALDGEKKTTTFGVNEKYAVKTVQLSPKELDDNFVTVLKGKTIAEIEKIYDGDFYMEDVADLYKEIGSVSNPELGDVQLTKTGIKHAHNKGEYNNKMVGYELVPAVIEKGKVIEHQKNWKNRGYDTATIAGKVRINKEECLQIVVVKRIEAKNSKGSKQNYDLHEVITIRKGGISFQDGSSTLNEPLRTVEMSPNLVKRITDRMLRVNTESVNDAGNNYSINESFSVDASEVYKNDPDFKSVQQYVKQQLEITKNWVADKADVEKVAKKVLKQYGSTYGVDELTTDMNNYLKYVKNAKSIRPQLVQSLAAGIAKRVLEKSAELDTTMEENYGDLRTYCKTTKLHVTEDVIAEFGSRTEYNDFRKSMFGKMRLSTTEGIGIDVAFKELSELYPELFDEMDVANTADQLQAIADTLDYIKPTYINPYGADINETAVLLGNDIIQELEGVKRQVSTFAEEVMDIRRKYELSAKKLKDKMEKSYDEKLQKAKKENVERIKRFQDRFDKALGEEKAKYGKAVSRLKEQKVEAVQVEKQRWIDKETDRNVRFERRKLKQDINKIMNDFSKRLLDPTEKKHIPREFMKSVIDVCNEVNLDSGWRNPDGSKTKTQQRFEDLQRKYALLKEDADYMYASEYNEKLAGMIEDITELFREKSINQLSNDELQKVYDTLSALQKSITDAAKLLDMETRYDAYEYAEKVWREIGEAKGYKDTVIGRVGEKYVNSQLSPIREFRRQVGYKPDSAWVKMAEELNKGQLKETQTLMEGTRFFDSVIQGKTNQKKLETFQGKKTKWINTLKDVKGDIVEISPAMRVSLYLHSKNKSNMRHILGGGFTVPEKKAYMRGDYTEAYARGKTVKLTEESLNLFLKEMTEYEKVYADVAYKFFNEFTKEKVNETSMILNGFKKAEVQNYFPIRTDKNFSKADFESIVNDGSIEGMGFLKKRTVSSVPILLEDVTNVVDRQLKNMAKYHGMAIPVRNFNKIYNVTAQEYETSVKKALNQTWGLSGSKYMENLLADIQGARNAEGSLWDDIRGKFAGATLAINVSVTLKQVGSYPAAAAVIGWEPVIKALSVVKGNSKYLKKDDKKLIEKYTALRWLRNKGNSTQELGDIVSRKQIGDKYPWLFNWIQMGEMTITDRLWYASEYYVDAKYPELKEGSDEYYRKAAEVYNKVIEETQSNYSTMQRPDILRNPNKVMKQALMFMTQNLQNMNLFYDSYQNMVAQKRRYKKDKSEENKKIFEESAKEFSRVVSSQVVAALSTAVAGLTAGAVLHKMNPYRNDDGEITAESIGKELLNITLGTLSGSMVGGSELYELIYSCVTKETYYGYEFSVVQMISDLGDSIYYMANAADACMSAEDEEGKKKAWSKFGNQFLNFAVSVSKFGGVPVKNVMNIFNGAKQHVEDLLNSEFGSFEAGYNYSSTQNEKRLYDAIVMKDMKTYNKIVAELKADGKDDAQINSMIRSYLKENDDRVMMAAVAKQEGNYIEYTTLVKQMAAEGFDEQKHVVSAINAAYNTLVEHPEGASAEAEEKNTIYDYDMLANVYANGSYEEFKKMYEDIVADLKIRGKSTNISSTAINAYNDLAEMNGLQEITYEELYEAQKRGDAHTYEHIMEVMKAYGRDEYSIQNGLTKEMNKDLKGWIEDNNLTEALNVVQILREHGKEDGAIHSTLQREYKPMYQSLYLEGDTEGMKQLEEMLKGLNLKNKSGEKYYTNERFGDWLDDVK